MVLHLGLVHDREARGIGYLRVVLGQLADLRQLLHLESLVHKRGFVCNGLTDLTLHRLVSREQALHWLLNMPSFKKH